MRNSLILSVLLSVSIACSAAPASTESINTLLAVTKAESLVSSMHAQMEQVMRQAMAQAISGKKVSEEQKRVLEAAPKQFAAVMKDEMSWANLKTMYINIYQETFTQEEVDGLIAFYRSPAGAAFVDKMPLVMQKSTAAMQARLPQLMEKMKLAMEKTLSEAGISR